MKKLLYCVLLIAMLTLMCSVAVAEGELPADPLDWNQLMTIGGATMFTLLVVQLLKLPLDKVWKIPTRIVAYVIALITMLLDRQPLGEVMFNTLGIVFVIVMGILEVMIYYRNRTDKKGADISSRRAL